MDLNHARLPFRHTRVARERILPQGREQGELHRFMVCGPRASNPAFALIQAQMRADCQMNC